MKIYRTRVIVPIEVCFVSKDSPSRAKCINMAKDELAENANIYFEESKVEGTFQIKEEQDIPKGWTNSIPRDSLSDKTVYEVIKEEKNNSVSEFYKANWERANKWLKENAPDYVNNTLEEAFETVKKLNDYSLSANKFFKEVANKGSETSEKLLIILELLEKLKKV